MLLADKKTAMGPFLSKPFVREIESEIGVQAIQPSAVAPVFHPWGTVLAKVNKSPTKCPFICGVFFYLTKK